MDKGLKKINELKQKIKELEKSATQNSSKIEDIVKVYEMLILDIGKFEEKNIKLSEEKKKSIEAPQKRQEKKKELIKSIILGYIVTTLIALCVVLIGSGGTVSIINCLLSSLALLSPVCLIAVPIEFKSINKKHPISNASDIESQILSNNKNLESAYSKKNELDTMLNSLKEKNKNYNDEINELQKEMDFIISIRASVIEEYCKNNSELDNKLDIAYDKRNKKEKVK